MTSKSGAQIKINEKGIAWKSDVEDMYKQPNNYMQTQWTDVTDGKRQLEIFCSQTYELIRTFYGMDETSGIIQF